MNSGKIVRLEYDSYCKWWVKCATVQGMGEEIET